MGCGKFFECFAVERTGFDHVLSVGSMISNHLKFRKQNSHGRGRGTRKALLSSIGPICWYSKYDGIIGLIYLPFVVSNS